MRIVKFISDFLSIRKEDVFLISFPKSGNTRIRMAIAKYYQLKYNVMPEFSYDWVNTILPAIGVGNIRDSRRIIQGASKRRLDTLFVKSHLDYSRLRFFRRSNKIIYIQRLDHEVIMSFYDYSKVRGTISNDMAFSDFLRSKDKGLMALIEHIETYNTVTDNVVNYDELMRDDTNVIIGALLKAGVRFDFELMKTAIEETRRKNVEKLDNKLDKEGYNFAAKKYRDTYGYFSTEDINFYNRNIQGTLLQPIEV